MGKIIRLYWNCLLFQLIVTQGVSSSLTSNPIPCDGHTLISCSRYCEKVDGSNGKCDGPRCICSSTNTTIKNINDTFCTSPACQHEASIMKSYMNTEVDPCDDFYDFSCGRFIEQVTTDNVFVAPYTILRNKVALQLKSLFEEPISSTEPKPFTLAKTLYKSCMDSVRLELIGFEPLLNILEKIGGWPVLTGNKERSFPDNWKTWVNYTIWLHEMGLNDVEPFVAIGVIKDVLNPEKKIIYIAHSEITQNDASLRQGWDELFVKSHYQYMVGMAVEMGVRRKRAATHMKATLEFMMRFARCFPLSSGEANINISADYSNSPKTRLTIEKLSTQFPSIPWLELFQRVMPSTSNITSQEPIWVPFPDFIDCVISLVARTSPRTLANYVGWRVVEQSFDYLHDSALSSELRLRLKIRGEGEQLILGPRWKKCTGIVQEKMDNAVGAMYIRHYFNENSRAEATEMVEDIKKAFRDTISENTWMDAWTNWYAREKALLMRFNIGYPEEHKDDTKISAFYANYEFNQNDFFGNILKANIESISKELRTLRLPIQREEWSAFGENSEVNAFYHISTNSFQIPAAALQGHYFNADRPKYLNYASIGWVIGHEVIHGFDNIGHQYDKNGNLANWWDSNTKRRFDERAECFVDQYSTFVACSTELQLDGDDTLQENIADNGGIKQAYRGYQLWLQRHGTEKGLPGLGFTPQQLFWITAAQSRCSVQTRAYCEQMVEEDDHSPPEFRVIGTFSNSKDFAKDFQCKPGTRMNPVKKCSIW